MLRPSGTSCALELGRAVLILWFASGKNLTWTDGPEPKKQTHTQKAREAWAIERGE